MSASASSSSSSTIDSKCVATIRCLAADMPTQAKSGHPGAPLGCAPMAYVLFSRIMQYAPSHPEWWNRDRFVLSNGHGCALLYSLLHLVGYDEFSLDQLRNFRQLNSKTPGHPENTEPGVEVTTGPLGQGMANAVGIAIAQDHLAATYNKGGEFDLFSHFTYVITGDGCHQEGVTGEAASLAGHLKLGRLIVLYDDNDITIDGGTELSFSEDVGKRFEAYGWQVLTVAEGDDNLEQIEQAIKEAQADLERPTLIKVRTTIGFGSAKQGTSSVHGSPLTLDDLAAVKSKFGLPSDKTFHVPDDVRAHLSARKQAGTELYQQWQKKLTAYAEKYPELAAQLNTRFSKSGLPANWKQSLTDLSFNEAEPLATRKMSGSVLNKLAPVLPQLVGGSADLTPSNCTWLESSHNYSPSTKDGRYIRFGVREHAMAAISNGFAAYGGFIPFCATFLNFVGYALGAIRLSSLSHFRVIYIMTHDSIGLGEDGPTHQPIETLSILRSTPNHNVWRPADANEVSAAYIHAVESTTTPSTIALTRQNVDPLEQSSIERASHGGYIVFESNPPSASSTTAAPQLQLVATGSEVGLAIRTARFLATETPVKHVRVISLPCWQLFEAQSIEYKQSVFASVPTLAIEAASPNGWYRYSHAQHCMRSFGASAPASQVFKHFGFTVEALTEKAQKLVKFFETNSCSPLPVTLDMPF